MYSNSSRQFSVAAYGELCFRNSRGRIATHWRVPRGINARPGIVLFGLKLQLPLPLDVHIYDNRLRELHCVVYSPQELPRINPTARSRCCAPRLRCRLWSRLSPQTWPQASNLNQQLPYPWNQFYAHSMMIASSSDLKPRFVIQVDKVQIINNWRNITKWPVHWLRLVVGYYIAQPKSSKCSSSWVWYLLPSIETLSESLGASVKNHVAI